MSEAKKLQNKNDVLSQAEYQWNSRILVVEDEPGITKSYQDILQPKTDNVAPIRSSRNITKTEKKQNISFEVDVAKNAEEALALVQKSIKDNKPYAMGFFDVLLGEGMDGISLYKEVYQLDPHLFVVFVTAYNDRSVNSIQEFLGEETLKRWDYLNKPFSNGEILQKARNYVSLWNFEKENEAKDLMIAETHRKMMEFERTSSVSALARGVTHEFGNILMQIMGKADLSLKKSPEEMKKGLEVILDATMRANKILERFKNLSDKDESVNEMREVYLHEVLNKAFDLMEHQFRMHQIKVSRVKVDTVKASINETSMLQVIVNVTINAIHAMGDTGQIDYSVINSSEGPEIRIRDYGPGVKPEVLEKMKEAFFTTKGEKGTGLGLSICNEIIEIEHGGKFILQNNGVKGLEVIIKLPKSSLE